MSPAFLQLMALPWPKLARAALLVLPLVAHAAQACSALQYGHTSNKHTRSPGEPSVIEEMISNFYYVPPTESLPELLAHSAGLVSTQPHGDSQHVGAAHATSGAPIQFQQAGQTGSKYPARFGLDYSGNYFPQSSSTAAAHGVDHSSAVEHGGGVQLPAHPAAPGSKRPYGELQHVRAATATSGAPAQFQYAGQTGSKYPARFGLDNSGQYLAQSSSAAAAHGGSYPQEHGDGGQPAQMGVPTEPVSFPRDNTYFAPQRMVHVAQSSHQGFPATPTAINHAGSSPSLRGARTAPRPDHAPELTEAAHGSGPSRLPDSMSEVKLFPATLERIERQYEQLSGSNAFLLGMSKAGKFDSDGARLDAARKAGLEDDARNLLAEGKKVMELRRLLERSIRYSDPQSKWYVATDEELRTWLGHVYSLRERISSSAKDVKLTANDVKLTSGIKAHVRVDRDTRAVDRLLGAQQESRFKERHRFKKQHLVGPFEKSGDVEEPFVFASYVFRLMRSSSNFPETGQIAVLPFESFFNYDPIVLKLPILTPGILKRADLPTAIEHAGSSSSLRRARTVPRPEDATEPTEAAHGSASSHLPGNTRKVKLTKPSGDQIELAYKELSASPSILEGLTKAQHFDSNEARLAAALKAGLEDDARNLLAQGIEIMEPKRLLERSLRYRKDQSNWYVTTDEELRAWLMRVYTLRERILRFPHDVKYTYSIEALEGLERVTMAVDRLREVRNEARRSSKEGSLPSNHQLPEIVGPFQRLRAVKDRFVFGAYVFRVLQFNREIPNGRQIAMFPYEPFFNDDPIVLKLPLVAPGLFKFEKLPARLDQSEVS